MSHTAFIVRVPQAEALVGDLRARFDACAALGVPVHITVLFPFMAAERIDAGVLQGIRTALDGAPAPRCGRWREMHTFALAAAGAQV